eukprot:TRINITY_DN59809_c0_g1_i1.p1 TRINITY_DN59809_c0_g1~~TRINITY_DN59809_c0_g1_i1.p1  ORF type:complete len:275 (-),score=19.84 TRINITY_DN59809_c0_g1_i1:499-1278(-)
MADEIFKVYEQEFIELEGTLSREIAGFAALNREKKIRKKVFIDEKITDLKDALSSMEAEVHSLPAASRGQLKQRCKGFKDTITTIEKKYQQAKAGGGQAAKDREELLAGATLDNGRASGKAAEDRQTLMDQTKALEGSSSYISNAKKLLQESEETAVGITGELGRQRDVLTKTGHTIGDIEMDLVRSNNIMGSIHRRLLANKLMMFGVILIIVVIILVVLWLKVISPHVGGSPPAPPPIPTPTTPAPSPPSAPTAPSLP